MVASQHGSLLREGGGRHNWRFVKAGYRSYPVGAHNGLRTEIPWVYIRGLCRAHEIPESAFTDE